MRFLPGPHLSEAASGEDEDVPSRVLSLAGTGSDGGFSAGTSATLPCHRHNLDARWRVWALAHLQAVAAEGASPDHSQHRRFL